MHRLERQSDALLDRLKEQERIQGRPSRYPKWTSEPWIWISLILVG